MQFGYELDESEYDIDDLSDIRINDMDQEERKAYMQLILADYHALCVNDNPSILEYIFTVRLRDTDSKLCTYNDLFRLAADIISAIRNKTIDAKIAEFIERGVDLVNDEIDTPVEAVLFDDFEHYINLVEEAHAARYEI